MDVWLITSGIHNVLKEREKKKGEAIGNHIEMET